MAMLPHAGRCLTHDRAGFDCFRSAAALVAALLMLLVADAASAAFSGRTFVSPKGQFPLFASAAIDADGRILYVWDDFSTGRISIRARSASGAFGNVETISPAGESATAPAIAVAPAGRAIIVWLVNDGSGQRIRGRTRSASGSLGKVKTFATGSSFSNIAVAMDAAGNAFVLWTDDSSLVQLRALSKDNKLAPAETIVTDDSDSFSQAQMAVTSKGVAQITWLRDIAGKTRVEARSRSKDGVLAAIKKVTGPTPEPIAVRIAIDKSGRALIAWMEMGGAVSVRTRATGGTLGPKHPLGTGDSTQQIGVSSDAVGNAVIAWNTNDGIDARPLSAAGSTGSVQQLAEGDNATLTGQSTLKDGRTIFLWMTVQPSPTKVNVFARLRRTNGTYTAKQALSPDISGTTLPYLATGPAGDAAALWTRSVGSRLSVESIFGP